MKYYAVTGRMCGDDEDTVELISVKSRKEAIAEFRRRMWEYTGMEGEELAEAQAEAEANGEGVFINHILVSTAPITSE